MKRTLPKSERPAVTSSGAFGNRIKTCEGLTGRFEACPALGAPSTLGEPAEEFLPFAGEPERFDGPEHYFSDELVALLDWPYSPSLREGGAM